MLLPGTVAATLVRLQPLASTRQLYTDFVRTCYIVLFRINKPNSDAFEQVWTRSVLATSLVAGVWGGVAWLQRVPAVGFWYVLRASQVLVVIQVGLGSVLLLLGHEAPDGLHYVYGVLPLFVSLVAETVRAGATGRELTGVDFEALPRARQHAIALAIARREQGVMAVSALVVFLLALRAAGTSGGLF